MTAPLANTTHVHLQPLGGDADPPHPRAALPNHTPFQITPDHIKQLHPPPPPKQALQLIQHSAAVTDDAHSQATAAAALAAVVPAWVGAGRDPRDLWESLAGALAAVPPHRRLPLLAALLRALPKVRVHVYVCMSFSVCCMLCAVCCVQYRVSRLRVSSARARRVCIPCALQQTRPAA